MGLVSKRGEGEEERGEISIAGLERLDGGADESVFELDEWSERHLGLLRERLETLGVPHTWETPSTLVISEPDEAWVERIMDQVEDDLSLSLDPEVGQTAYDLAGWDDENRDVLFTSLEDEAVPYGMDGDELIVHEIDEQRVDELIEAIVTPDTALDAPAGDADAMGDLFVAADRLVRLPADPEGAVMLVQALRTGQGAPPPYGMDKVWWEGVLSQADGIATQLAVEDPDDSAADAISGAAEALRIALRPYV